MVAGLHKRSAGIFSHRHDVETALHELRDSGFDMNRVSVVVQDTDGKHDIAGAEMTERVGNKADEGATVGAVSGGALGGLTGLLVGLGALAIPGIGPVMLAGATATAIATTLAGVGIGAAAGTLLGGLVGLGIPEEQAKVYNARVERGHYLVIIDGTDAEIASAEKILHHHGVEDYGIYNQPHGSNTATTTTNAVITPPALVTNPAPVTNKHQRAIGVFSHRQAAEDALTELRDAGFDLGQISLIAKNADTTHSSLAGNKADEGAKAGAVTGGALGGLGGLLVGLGALAIPGVGPVLLSGAAATALATALTGGAIGAAAGGIGGALVGIGIPEERAKVYSDRFQKGDYIIMVDGTAAEIHQAEAILKRRGIEDFAIYDATDLPKAEHPQTRGVESTPANYVPHPGDDPLVIVVDHRADKSIT